MQADTPEDTRDLLRFLPTVLTEQLHKHARSANRNRSRAASADDDDEML